MDITNVRSGLRLTRSNSVLARLQTTGLQLSDLQARFKQSIYAKVWLANSGRGSVGPTPDSTSQLLGPLATRAAAVEAFARDRRRAALCVSPDAAAHAEKFGQFRQQWRRLLEIQLLHRASDFAMFLLSPTHRSESRQHVPGSQLQPLENYRTLFQQHMKGSLPRSASPGMSASPSEPATSTTNSPSRIAVSDAAAANRSQPAASREISGHARSLSALDAVAALFSRSNRVVTTHRKSTSLVQMLGAVTNQNLHRMVTLKQTAGLLIGHGSTTDGGLLAPARDGPIGLARTSMGRIPEDTQLPASSVFGFIGNAPAGGSDDEQPATNLNSARDGKGPHPVLPGKGGPPLFGSVDAGHASVRALGRSGSLGADVPDSASAVQSAFITAREQSRAAAQSQSGGDSISSFAGPSEADAKLSFVQAFRHLGSKVGRRQRLASVYNMPLTNPVIAVAMAQAAGDNQPIALQASCNLLVSCVGVHSVGSLLLMSVQIQQAMQSSARAEKSVARSPSSDSLSPAASRGLKATFELGVLRMKVVMEEPPRRVKESSTSPDHTPPEGEQARVPGLTELTSIELSDLSVKLSPASSKAGSASRCLEVEIADVSILDLQGCIEHRNVLVAKSYGRPSTDAGSSARQRRQSSACSSGLEALSASEEGGHACRVKVAYLVPSSPDASSLIRVSVHDPCVTWLRRYTNNMLYAVGVISEAYRSAVRQGAAATPQPAAAGAAHVQPPGGQQAAACTEEAAPPAAAQSLPPGILVEAFNLKAVLPGGAAARHGPIRRAVHNEAISVEMQSMAVYIPGGDAGLLGVELIDLDGLDEGAVWMTMADEVDGLISSSLRLGEKHFPQANQQPSVDERANIGSSRKEAGGGLSGRQRRPCTETNAAGASSPTNLLQKHLQAAKATFIDPLKEILQEAGQKRTKQRGEVGFLLIDEGPARGPTGEVNPGYLNFEDAESRQPTAAAQHTTTTVYVASARDAAAGASVPATSDVGACVQLQHPAESNHPTARVPASGRDPNVPSSRAVNGAEGGSVTSSNGARHSPMVLVSISGLAATSCKIVPYDDNAYRRRRPAPELPPQPPPSGPSQHQRQAGLRASHGASRIWTLPADLCNVVLYDVVRLTEKERVRQVLQYDSQVESALDLLADTELQSVRPLIDPVQLKGAVFQYAQHNAVQVHFSALGAMVATLGPQRYKRLMKVLTDNVSEAFSCFNVGAKSTANTAQRRTTFSAGTDFAPKPGQLPYFHLTVEWLDRLHVALESDPAWWKPNRTPALETEACLQSCFTQCSLGLMMTHKTNDLFLAFYSQQVHIADVRISARDEMLHSPGVSAVYAFDVNGGEIGVDMTEQLQAEASRRPSGDFRFHRSSGGAETLCDEDEDDAGCTANNNMDAASTETPDSHNVQPVVDDQLGDTFPGTSAVVTLLRSNIDLPADESAHLAGVSSTAGDPVGSGECPRDGRHDCVRASFTMSQDGTMANEIELCHTLVQWPYLTEMSLVSSIIAIFLPGWGCPSSGPEAQLRLAATPWLYFNLLLRNSQIFVPVLTPHLRHLAYGWRAAAAQAAGEDIQLTPEKLQQLFASMVEDAAAVGPTTNAAACGGDKSQRTSDRRPSSISKLEHAQSSVQAGPRSTRTTLSPLGDPVLSGNWATLSMRHMADMASSPEHPRRLEQMGLVISMAALRVGHFAGGDGDSIMKVDLQNAAGFVRHSSAQVTNWLLPIRSMVLDYRCSMPMVEESKALEEYILTARVMLRRCLRMLRGKKALRKVDDNSTQPQHFRLAEVVARQRAEKAFFPAGTVTHDSDGLSVPGPGGNADDARSARSRAAFGAGAITAQEFLVEQATSRAAWLLELHKLPLPSSSASRVAVEKLLLRQPAVSKLTFELDTAVIRASFSNIPLWHALMDDVNLATKLMEQNNGLFSPAPAVMWAGPLESPKAGSEAAAEAKATWNFRPTSTSINASIKSLGLVLCDDKPKSYGAPDVLTAAMEQVATQYSVEKRYPDHLPEQSGCISLSLAAQFLNNSTGRWEHLLEPWPAELHLSDPINPVFKSSRTKYVYVSSSELMKLTFHPSCLLTLGDTLAFVRRLCDRQDMATVIAGRSHNAAPVAEDPPSVSEQMALSGSIMTRVPQRYLIQNHTGLLMSYWAPKADSDLQPASGKRVLPSGCSEELQVTPTAKQVKIVGPGGVVLTRLQAQVIVLNFEGAWMPISDVSVDVVGKYCYDLHSPTDDRHAPVVVDVALVGRTKILKIHSALYIQNNTSLRLSFRLHFPSVLLAGQVALGAGDQRLPGDQDITLRVLKPKEGRYLPVVAALGGSLYLEARTPTHPQKGWCVYGTSKHDVIRLFPNVTDMLSQAGFIASGLPINGQKGLYINSPLHFAVKILVKTRTEYSYTTFHSMEVPGPGLFAKASRPLEASIQICPTVELTNSLPYHMEGYLISLNGVSREPEASATGSASLQAAPRPSTAYIGRPRAATNGGAHGMAGGLQPLESRRLIKGIRRSDTTLPEEIPGSDQNRIISVFERSLLPMLNQKAKNLWDGRAKHLGSSAPNDKTKCFLLALLRYELRWTVKRNAKEMELLVRTDMEPADRISWQELEAFLEWAKQSIRLVHVQPGDTQCLYLDMHKQVVMCIKVPERKLVCTRPVEVNYSSGTANSGEVELPDFMRLDYIDDTGKGFADVWDKMRAGNHSETPMNLMKVVNQQFRDLRDTAAAVRRDTTAAVVNTVRGVRDAALDVFSGPHGSKLVQASTMADVTALDDDSTAYWRQNPDKVIRVQLLIQPGPGSGGDTTSLGDRRAEGALNAALSSSNETDGHHGRNLAAALSMAAHPGPSSVPMVAGAVEGLELPSAKRPSEPGVQRNVPVMPLSSSPVAMAPVEVRTAELVGAAAGSGLPHTCLGPGYPVSPFATPVTKSAGGTDKCNADVDALSSGNAGVPPEQSICTSPNGAARSDVPSPSLGALPPVRAILDKLRSSVIKFQDSRASSPGKLGGRDAAGTISAAVPHLDGHICVRLSYRPDAAPAQASRTLRIGRGIQAAFNGLAHRAKGGIVAVSTPRPSRSSGEALRPSSEQCTVRVRLHVVPATPGAPEFVRVQLVVSPTPLLDCMEEAGVAPLHESGIRGHRRCDDAADLAGVDIDGAGARLRGNQMRMAPGGQPLDDNTVTGPCVRGDAVISSSILREHCTAAADHLQAVTTPASSVLTPRTTELTGSPYTPGAKSSCGAMSHTSHLPTAFATGAASASPGSVVMLHSGPVSPISVPGGPLTGRQVRPTRHPGASIHCQASLDAGAADHATNSHKASPAETRSGVTLGAGTLALGEDSASRGDATDAVRSQSPQETAGAPTQRSDAFWSENAAYKCCSSISTLSGSDLPTRVLPSDFQQCYDVPKAVPASGETYPGAAQLPSVKDTVRSVTRDSPADGTLGVAERVSEGSLAPHPYNGPAAVGPPSAGPGVLGPLLPATLSEGYAQLEMLHASGVSPLGRGSRVGRRSATLSGSLSLRRAPSKPSRSAGGDGLSSGARDGVSQSASAAGLEGPSSPDGELGVAASAHHVASKLGDAPPSAMTADDLLGSPFMVGKAVHGSGSPNAHGRAGEVIKDVTTSGAAGIDNSAGTAIPPNPSCHEQHDRRLTADDVISIPRELDGGSCAGDFDLNAAQTDALVASASGRKVQSEKRIGERIYGLRFHERAMIRGIGKKGSVQPSYKAFQARGGRTAPSPIALAKSAIQVVPRLPGIARNVGGKFVDGGQQVIQGVPHVASLVADKVIAGGQGVKERMVESTEHAIKIAKPKIERGLMSMAWKATEAMRKRKQGTDEMTLFEDSSKPPRGGKRRAEVERAPKVLLLSVHNSLAKKEDDHVCRLSLYAAYWVDNRTGFNLLFKDLDAPAGLDNLPFLLWHPVQVPGNKTDASGFDNLCEQPGLGAGAGVPQLDRNSVPRIDRATVGRRGSHAQLPHKPALLNDQTRTRFRISHPHYSGTDFCVAFTIANTNQKYSVDLKGEKSEAKVARSEIVYSRRPSAHSGFLKAVAVAAQKEHPTGTVSLPPLPDNDHVSSSNLQLGAPGSERPAQHQQQAQPDVPRPAADSDGQPRQQSGLADRDKGFRGGAGMSVEEPTMRATAGGALEAEPKQMETPSLPSSSLNPVDLEGSSPAAPVVSGCRREDVPRVSSMPQGVVMFARRPLETVCEITPAEEESDGRSPSVNPSCAPGPSVLERLHSGRLLEAAADSTLGADAAVQPVPPKPTIAVSLSDKVSLPVVEARANAGGDTLSPMLPITGGGGRRRTPRFRKGRGAHAVGDGIHGQEPAEIVPVRRLYQFAVEVWAAPSDTAFSRTKIITVKNKYLILNATGLTIEYKQKGTPDPGPTPTKDTGFGKGVRFSRKLDNNARAAWHWDNVFAEQELMIRPAGDEWDWSGSFKLPELEDYFGLRIRHRQRNDYVIIPVNISVGPAGSVLITLKSIGSVPPYMVINRCRDVVIHLKQADYNRRRAASSDAWDDWDKIQPGSNQIPFAWDEPRLRHVVKVVATAQQGADPDQASAIDVDVDAVEVNSVLYVQSRSMRTLPLAAQLDARERAKFLTDNAKKVYVTVHADGPTRVLCFSEDRSGVAYSDDDDSLLNLSYRLQRVAARLTEVDQKLVQQLGGSLGSAVRHDLDGPLNGSQGAAGSATSPEEARLPLATRFGAPRVFGVGMAVGRQGLLQLPAAPASGGTPTPLSARMSVGGLGGQVGQASFAFQRLPSTGQRAGSTYTVPVAPGAYRHPSVPNNAAVHFNPTAQRMQQGRSSPSSQSHDTCAPKFAGPTEGPSVHSVHSDLAAPTGDQLSRPMETLPAFEGYVDLPIGGDLTVVLRAVEGLSSALKSNEKLVAVEAKMAVVSSTPDLDGGSSPRRVTASWTQAADAPALSSINTGASGGGDGGGNDGSSGGGFGAGLNPSLGYAGRVTLQDHMEVFRDIAASSELQIDFYIAKGAEQPHASHVSSQAARPKNQHAAAARSAREGKGHVPTASASRGTGNASTAQRLAVSSGQFAGCVRVPLMSTIECDKSQVWRLPLERKTGAQLVRGYVSLSFQWSLTNEGMLVREVTTLERILDEKIELLAQLNPLSASASSAFVRDPAAPAAFARQDATAATGATSTAAVDIVGEEIALSHGAGGAATTSLARPSPARKTAKALAESYNVNLELSVLEIAGLLPREGIRASIAASMYGRQTANMMSIAMLPRAAVSMSCGVETRLAAAGSNSVNPRFPKNTAVFQNVPLSSKVSLKVLDQVSGSYHKVLAEAEIQLSHIPGTDPVYAWLALKRRKHGSRSQRVLAMLMVMEEEGDADVQMLVRIKINKPQIHGVALAVTLDLAGVGLCAKTNLEELFNYTMQKIRTSLVQKRTEVQVSLAVQTIQLDNQMLEAKNPVVLSPADVSGSSSLAQARRRHKARLAQRMGPTNPVLRMGGQDSALQDPLLTFQVVYNQASSNHAMVNSKGQEDSVGILAFKKVILELGPMDFSADQEFIEGIVAYLNGIPLEDFYQEKAWQEKIDAMQGGSMTLLGAAAEDLAVLGKRDKMGDALAWLAAKEAKELELLRGQSSMWFYLEEFYLSDVFINVTLALSSSFNTGGSVFSSTNAYGKEDDRQRSMVRGFLSRVSGSNGFQLINVTNVPIQLEYVELQNHLVNRVSLVNKLYRHYSWIAIAQARKVLGGAGPAIAAIPASLLWAGIALFDLGQDVAAKRVNPLVVPTRMGYVTFTLMGQIVGVMSRTMCAIMGLLPPRFSSDTVNLSDSETARRFGIKPQTLMDALYLSQRDVVLGLMSAAFGVIHDTAAGGRWKGGLVAIGVPMGLLKASVGLGMRPAAGAVEATSKLLQGLGLMCLGKRGIQGKLVRRVQAPGLAVTDVVQAARASAAQAAIQGALIAAWQAALPAISSALADDEVVDVVAARSTRVVLLTNRHLAYLYARRHAASSSASSSASGNAASGAFSVTYRVKWIIPNGHIDNIRGLDRGYAVSVEYHKPVKLGRLSLKLPLHKGMRTATAEGHKDLIFRLNRHIGRAVSSGESGAAVATMQVDARRGEARGEVNVRDLSIMDVTGHRPGIGTRNATQSNGA